MVNGRGTRILVTSRDQEGAGFGIGLPVPPLNESEAVRMLLHHARREFKALDEFDHDQGGGGTRIPNQGSEGGGPAEGRKKKSDLTDFDGGSG